MAITIDTAAFNKIMRRFDTLEKMIKELTQENTGKWMDEAEVIRITGLGKDSLRRKRKDNVFTWSSATGRKIKYLRKDVMDYLNDNSTRPER